MRRFGWVMIIVAASTIGYYRIIAPAHNQRQLDDHPWMTLLAGGENLEKQYTFTPPLTGFELAVYGSLAAGGLMIFFGKEN